VKPLAQFTRRHAHRAGPQVPRHNAGPGYWMNETSGVLRPAIVDYLKGRPLDEAKIAAIRAYLRQWIMHGDWAETPAVETLRQGVDGLTSRQAIGAWLQLALEHGIDPL
jgi:hypothetical protein